MGQDADFISKVLGKEIFGFSDQISLHESINCIVR